MHAWFIFGRGLDTYTSIAIAQIKPNETRIGLNIFDIAFEANAHAAALRIIGNGYGVRMNISARGDNNDNEKRRGKKWQGDVFTSTSKY